MLCSTKIVLCLSVMFLIKACFVCSMVNSALTELPPSATFVGPHFKRSIRQLPLQLPESKAVQENAPSEVDQSENVLHRYMDPPRERVGLSGLYRPKHGSNRLRMMTRTTRATFKAGGRHQDLDELGRRIEGLNIGSRVNDGNRRQANVFANRPNFEPPRRNVHDEERKSQRETLQKLMRQWEEIKKQSKTDQSFNQWYHGQVQNPRRSARNRNIPVGSEQNFLKVLNRLMSDQADSRKRKKFDSDQSGPFKMVKTGQGGGDGGGRKGNGGGKNPNRDDQYTTRGTTINPIQQLQIRLQFLNAQNSGPDGRRAPPNSPNRSPNRGNNGHLNGDSPRNSPNRSPNRRSPPRNRNIPEGQQQAIPEKTEQRQLVEANKLPWKGILEAVAVVGVLALAAFAWIWLRLPGGENDD